MGRRVLPLALLALLGCGGSSASPGAAEPASVADPASTAPETVDEEGEPTAPAEAASDTCRTDADCPPPLSCICPAGGEPGPDGRAVCAEPARCYDPRQAPVARP